MIGYLDTSAFVPLLVAERTSAACRRFWEDVDAVVSTRLLYVESAATLALAHRLGRVDDSMHSRAVELLDALWPAIDVLELDGHLMRTAAHHARAFALRGYDSVHCAAATVVNDDDLVAATGDRALLAAWQRLGLATYDSTQS